MISQSNRALAESCAPTGVRDGDSHRRRGFDSNPMVPISMKVCSTVSNLRLILTGSLCSLLAWTVAAQTPPPALQVSVSPPDGTILITETTNSVFVAIGNFDVFTNLTVLGSFVGRQNISFLDDGQVPDQMMNDGIFSKDLVMPKVPVGTVSNVTLRLVVTGEVPPPDPLPDPPP